MARLSVNASNWASMWRARILGRLTLLALIASSTAFRLWPVPWTTYLAFSLPALLLYALLWGRPDLQARFGWVHVPSDMLILALLVRATGGGSSPFAHLAYLWLFGVVLLYMRRGGRSSLPFVSALLLGTLALGMWGTPGGLAALGAHAVGLLFASLLGLVMLEERSRNLVDPLTNVLHRRAGLELLEDKMARGTPFTLAFVDLHGFKEINDGYGHVVGDEVICAVAARLAAGLRRGDLVMRYGGDEFVVASDARSLRPRLETRFNDPVQTSAGRIRVGADIGEVTWWPGESLEELLRRADRAMYGQKVQAYRDRPRGGAPGGALIPTSDEGFAYTDAVSGQPEAISRAP